MATRADFFFHALERQGARDALNDAIKAMIVDLRYSPVDLTSEIHEAIDTVGTELGMEAVYIEGSIDYYGEDTGQRATEEREREATRG